MLFVYCLLLLLAKHARALQREKQNLTTANDSPVLPLLVAAIDDGCHVLHLFTEEPDQSQGDELGHHIVTCRIRSPFYTTL